MTRDPHDANAIIDELTGKLRISAREVVPWFLAGMPRRYFQDTEPAARLQHMAAILAMRASAMPVRLVLKNADESEWTIIQDRDYPGLLAELLDYLPRDRPLESAKVHTSADDDLVLDVFRFAGDRAGFTALFDPGDPTQAKKRAAVLDYARGRELDLAPGDGGPSLDEFIGYCRADYLKTVTPFRLVDAWLSSRALAGTDDTRVVLEREDDAPDVWRVAVFTGNAATYAMVKRAARYLGHAQLDIQRAYLDHFDGGPERTLLAASFVVHPPAGKALDGGFGDIVRRDLARIKWIDDRPLELAYGNPELGLLRAEVVCALSQLTHPALASENRYAFSRDRILAICSQELALSAAIADLFIARFDPRAPLSVSDRDDRIRELVLRLEREVDEPDNRRALTQLLLAVQATVRTNAFVEGRYGLAIRLDPAHLGLPQPAGTPFGAFFVTGRGFSGFHVRFRDIARGGMRVVRTSGPAHHTLEAERLYREVYELAFAQQLKNKDIPEGGAKAVILAEPGEPIERCVKAFADGLLDLLMAGESSERLYLGPDENISPALIEWIVDRARRRGYPTPDAFMSSKPGAGINHKVYGVTSEGVTVFLEEALREVGIDPRTRPFTVKLTGGPDGDVAGNEIRILHREYGDRARIVGIADGSGCAEDPDGLDHGELLRLFEAGSAIAGFDRAKLGPRGRLAEVAEKDGIKLRNTMHNRVMADAFIPAGGRPATIDESNWRQYAIGSQPASRVIVEGANLFITAGAREALSRQAGVVIIKDSSANKCGVICSSFEIMASMLLSAEEFLAVKVRFVAEVLERLRQLARQEARLLFRERRHHPGVTLPQLSTRLSEVILRTTDAIEQALPAVEPGDRALLDALIVEHVPAILLERVGDRLHSEIPPAYLSGIIAATLAGKIVYREGLAFLADLDHAGLADLALRYLRQEQETKRLVAEITASQLDNRERIAEIVRMAGSRAGLLLG